METPISQAIRSIGGQSALARSVGVSPQAVQQWFASGRVPAERVVDVETATGIPREVLRPDLYKKAA